MLQLQRAEGVEMVVLSRRGNIYRCFVGFITLTMFLFGLKGPICLVRFYSFSSFSSAAFFVFLSSLTLHTSTLIHSV